jgi:CheY-like chemotaxis protein
MFKVLVIDDDEGILLLMQTALKRANHEALIARSGDEGIRLAQTHQPDLIILDDAMPVMSGREVCAELRSTALTRDIPIIISSASLETNNPRYAQTLGADGLLAKPFRPQDIIDLVNRLARR